MLSPINMPNHHQDSKRKQYEKIAYQKLIKQYQTTNLDYGSSVIKSIIYNEPSHIVALFKDYLLMDDSSEFLKRYYSTIESEPRLPRLIEYYDNYSKIYPNYNVINEGKYFYLNIQRKQTMIDIQEYMENENRRVKKPKNVIDLFNTEVYESIINDKNNEDIEWLFGKQDDIKEESEILTKIEKIINEIEINKQKNNDDILNNSNIKLTKKTVVLTNLKTKKTLTMLYEGKLNFRQDKRNNPSTQDSKAKTDRTLLDKIDNNINNAIQKCYQRNISGSNLSQLSNKIDHRFVNRNKEFLTFRYHHSNFVSGVNSQQQTISVHQSDTSKINHKRFPFQHQVNGRKICSRNIDSLIFNKINRSTLNGSTINMNNNSQLPPAKSQNKQKENSKQRTKNSMYDLSTDNFLLKSSKECMSNKELKFYRYGNKLRMISKDKCQLSLGKCAKQTIKMFNYSTKGRSGSKDNQPSKKEIFKVNNDPSASSQISKIPTKTIYNKEATINTKRIKRFYMNSFIKVFDLHSSTVDQSERTKKGSSECEQKKRDN